MSEETNLISSENICLGDNVDSNTKGPTALAFWSNNHFVLVVCYYCVIIVIISGLAVRINWFAHKQRRLLDDLDLT